MVKVGKSERYIQQQVEVSPASPCSLQAPRALRAQRFLRISAIHHNMAHFISESTVHKYQYSIEHFPETSSLMTSGSGTNYDFSICSRSSHSSLSLWELSEEWGICIIYAMRF